MAREGREQQNAGKPIPEAFPRHTQLFSASVLTFIERATMSSKDELKRATAQILADRQRKDDSEAAYSSPSARKKRADSIAESLQKYTSEEIKALLRAAEKELVYEYYSSAREFKETITVTAKGIRHSSLRGNWIHWSDYYSITAIAKIMSEERPSFADLEATLNGQIQSLISGR